MTLNINGYEIKPGADLASVDFSTIDLSDVNLSRANLTYTNFRNTSLKDSDLSYANLTGSILINTDLENSKLTKADLTNAYLTKADLTKADLTNANLTNANLSGANLTNANLAGIDLSRAKLFTIKSREITKAKEILELYKDGLWRIDMRYWNPKDGFRNTYCLAGIISPHLTHPVVRSSMECPTLGLFFYHFYLKEEGIIYLLESVINGSLSIFDKNSPQKWIEDNKAILKFPIK